jgi:hypothetical protein
LEITVEMNKCKLLAIFSIAFLQLQFAAHAQDVNAAAKQLNQYNESALPEKLFVHTDKAFYMAGEIIWFKLYAADGFLHRPLDLSKISYVELLNKEHKPVLQAKIGMKNGAGDGSFQLPYSINSGNYTLRAYTNWMKNNGADFFFEKSISIVNGLKNMNQPVAPTELFDIQFFPEGGNLVNGMESRVAFRVISSAGKSISCSGAVLNERNDTIVKFASLRFGMGRFDFFPTSGEKYHAIVKINEKWVRKELPVAFSQGLTMRINDIGDEKIKLVIQNNTGGRTVSLLAHTRGFLKLAATYQLLNGKTEIEIDKKQLGEGISHFTVFDEHMKPLAERLFFRKPADLALKATTDALSYSERKKVTVDISATAGQQPIAGNLSMSVYLLDSLQTFENTDIRSYLWLQSDLRGNIESPAYYFNATGTEVQEAADNLMLTHGWSRFRWDALKQQQAAIPEFIPETEGHIISGTIVNKQNNTAVANTTAYLSVPGEKSLFTTSVSDKKGDIRFNVKNFYGGSEVIVQPDAASDQYRIDNIANPFIERYSRNIIPDLLLTEKQSSAITDHSIEAQVGNTYHADKQQKFLYPKTIDTTTFYGTPSNRYFLDDYTRFTTMEEVIREYVRNVRLEKSGDKFQFRLYHIDFGTFFDSDPLVLLDGVPVSDADKIARFDPLKIKRIDVLARRFYQNNLTHNGILSFSTYQGNLAEHQLDPNALIIEYVGLQLQREFFSPVYETEAEINSRLPDLRNQLFWSPEIQTDKNGRQKLSFYTADIPGVYGIVLQGITASGLAGYCTTTFKVTR